MKLHAMILAYLIFGSLNVRAADREQPLTSTHQRTPTGVVRNAFAHETTKLQLEEDLNTYIDNGDENSLNILLEKHKHNKSLEDIVIAGINRCKSKASIDVSKRDLNKSKLEDTKSTTPQPSQILQKVDTPPLPSSHPSDARTIRTWIAGGLTAGIVIVAAVVCYFKWMRPTAKSH